MCTTCGCSGQSNTEKGSTANKNAHHHIHHVDQHDFNSVDDQARMVEVEQNLLSKNDHFAALNRAKLNKKNIAAFNLVSSPGSGKTSLLTRTIENLHKNCSIAVIEGDQQTDNDAARIREAGAQAIQINTGKGCHLDAHAVGHAIEKLNIQNTSLLFIENVGNLVCPAAFDLGERAKVVVLSVTEGDDKPLKYPDMFRASKLMLINKIDLLPYVDFDPGKTIEYARRINPDIEVILLSAKTGEGFEQWRQWLLT